MILPSNAGGFPEQDRDRGGLIRVAAHEQIPGKLIGSEPSFFAYFAQTPSDDVFNRVTWQ